MQQTEQECNVLLRRMAKVEMLPNAKMSKEDIEEYFECLAKLMDMMDKAQIEYYKLIPRSYKKILLPASVNLLDVTLLKRVLKIYEEFGNSSYEKAVWLSIVPGLGPVDLTITPRLINSLFSDNDWMTFLSLLIILDQKFNCVLFASFAVYQLKIITVDQALFSIRGISSLVEAVIDYQRGNDLYCGKKMLISLLRHSNDLSNDLSKLALSIMFASNYDLFVDLGPVIIDLSKKRPSASFLGWITIAATCQVSEIRKNIPIEFWIWTCQTLNENGHFHISSEKYLNILNDISASDLINISDELCKFGVDTCRKFCLKHSEDEYIRFKDEKFILGPIWLSNNNENNEKTVSKEHKTINEDISTANINDLQMEVEQLIKLRENLSASKQQSSSKILDFDCLYILDTNILLDQVNLLLDMTRLYPSLKFVIPTIVMDELKGLTLSERRREEATFAIKKIEEFPNENLYGMSLDGSLQDCPLESTQKTKSRNGGLINDDLILGCIVKCKVRAALISDDINLSLKCKSSKVTSFTLESFINSLPTL